MNPRILALAFAVALAPSFACAADDAPLRLWYCKPSEKWTDALPVGNGRLAAVVFGGVTREHLRLNEDTLTSGEPPADLRSLDLAKDFDHVTGLIKAGKNPRPTPPSTSTGSAATSSATSPSAISGSISPATARSPTTAADSTSRSPPLA